MTEGNGRTAILREDLDKPTAHPELELDVLGYYLLNPQQVTETELSGSDFASERNELIFRAILKAAADRGNTDPSVVATYLPADAGIVRLDLVELASRGVMTEASAQIRIERIREAAALRGFAELGHHIVSHAKRGDREALTAALHRFEELADKGAQRGLKTSSLGEVLAWRPRAFLIPGLLPRGALVVLAAEPKTGKSLVAQDWALRMAHGVDRWLERDLTPGSVLYLAGEGLGSLSMRAKAWLAAHPNERLCHGFHVAKLPVLNAQGLADLDAAVATHQPALVIVDTLSRALGERDANTEVGPLTDALCRICERRGCTIVLIHHLNKADREKPLLQRVKGDGATVADADAIIGLSKDRDGILRLETVMRDAESSRLALGLRIAPITLDDGSTSVYLIPAGREQIPDTAAEQETERRVARDAAEERVQRAAEVLRELGGKASSKEAITTRMGGKATLARAAFATALDRGLIVPEGTARDRVYRLATVPGVCVMFPPYTPQDGDGDEVPSRRRPARRDDEGTTRDDGDDDTRTRRRDRATQGASSAVPGTGSGTDGTGQAAEVVP